MDFNELSKIAKTKGIKIGFLTKSLYKLIAPVIPENETIYEMGEGLDKKSGNSSPIIITDRNIYFFKFTNKFGGFDQRVIPLSKVTSVSSKGGLLPSLVINDGTGEYIVERVGPKVNDLIKRINDLNSDGEVQVKSISSTDELRNLKSLLDDGILTEEEFSAKKKIILGL